MLDNPRSWRPISLPRLALVLFPMLFLGSLLLVQFPHAAATSCSNSSGSNIAYYYASASDNTSPSYGVGATTDRAGWTDQSATETHMGFYVDITYSGSSGDWSQVGLVTGNTPSGTDNNVSLYFETNVANSEDFSIAYSKTIPTADTGFQQDYTSSTNGAGDHILTQSVQSTFYSVTVSRTVNMGMSDAYGLAVESIETAYAPNYSGSCDGFSQYTMGDGQVYTTSVGTVPQSAGTSWPLCPTTNNSPYQVSIVSTCSGVIEYWGS